MAPPVWVVVVMVVAPDDADRIELHLQYVHLDIVRVATRVPIPFPALHAMLLSETRTLLSTLTLMLEQQRDFERIQARGRRDTGLPPTPVACLDPILYHDACTIYAGLLCAAATGRARSWFDEDVPCSCGAAAWAYTCTPPRHDRSGRLVRDCLDTLVGVCWRCLARRDLLPFGSTTDSVSGLALPGSTGGT